MKRILFVLLLSACGGVNANDWSESDTWRESGWQVINVIDWGQTLNINECYSDRCKEINPILGESPSRNEINAYFISSGLVHYGISKLLSPDARKAWQYFTIGFNAGNIYSNHRIGLRVVF